MYLSIFQVTRVLASDLDSGDNQRLIYDFDPEYEINDFVIDSDRGYIYVNASLSDSIGKAYRLPIVVQDKGIPSKSATTVLNMLIMQPDEEKSVSSLQIVTKTASYNQLLIAIIVATVTLALAVAFLIVIIVCRKSGRWSPDVTSDKSLSRKSDVTQETTLRSVNTSPELPVELGRCSSVLDDLGYLDIGGRTCLSHLVRFLDRLRLEVCDKLMFIALSM